MPGDHITFVSSRLCRYSGGVTSSSLLDLARARATVAVLVISVITLLGERIAVHLAVSALPAFALHRERPVAAGPILLNLALA